MSWGLMTIRLCMVSNLIQLKVIQKVVSLVVSFVSTLLLKSGVLYWNHPAAFGCPAAAV